jgi:putative ABC transport system permease protein
MSVWLQLFLAYTLILFLASFSYKKGLSQERELFVTSIRSAVQLIILGYTLKYIFSLRAWYWLVVMLGVMTCAAAFIGAERLKLKASRMFLLRVCFLSLFISTSLVFLPLLVLGVIKCNFREVLTLWGLVLGQAVSSLNLAQERLASEAINRRDEIEAKVALGASLKEALRDCIKAAVSASLIPRYNNLKAAGIVFIPGITAGMIIAGADPLKAVAYQIVVMYLSLAVSLLSAYLILLFTYSHVFSLLGKSLLDKKVKRGRV